MAALRKLAFHTVLYGFTNIAARLLNFFLTPFYTRYFTDPGDYGVITVFYAYMSFLNIVYTYGMETGFFYFANREERPALVGGTTFISLLFSSLLFSGFFIVSAPFLASKLHYAGHPEYITYGALILLFDSLVVIPFAWYRKEDQPMKFALLKVFGIMLNIFFNVFFLVLCPRILQSSSLSALHPFINAVYHPFNDIGYVFLSNVLSSLIVFLFTIPLILKRLEFKFNQKLWSAIFAYSWPLLILGFAGMINETFDRIMLDKRLPFPDEATRLEIIGKYSACYKLSIFMTLAVQSFRYAAEPYFFAELKKEGSKVVYAKVLKYFSYLAAFIFLCVTLFMPILIKIIGRNFRDAEAVIPILLMANLCLGLFIYLSQWYKQTEKTFYGAVISIAGAVLTIIINYYYIPRFSYMASAWATFVCYCFMAVATYLIGQKYYPVKYPVGRILTYIFSALLLWLAGRWIMDHLFGGHWNFAMYAVNILLIGAYITLFLALERPKLATIMNKVMNR